MFDDIILLPGGDLAFESASGVSFRLTPDLAGLRLRVKALYTDQHGVTEQVFSVPGFGKMLVDAVFNRDYAVVQGVALCTGVGFILLNLLADVAQLVLNPRLRAS